MWINCFPDYRDQWYAKFSINIFRPSFYEFLQTFEMEKYKIKIGQCPR